jgi:predicted lipoprotein with Yx(FWY)xxD motif
MHVGRRLWLARLHSIPKTRTFIMRTSIAIAMLAAASLALGACGTSKSSKAADDSATMSDTVLTSGPVNTMCPIGGHDVDLAVGTHDYKGHEVAFCCEGCYDAWPAMEAADRDAMLADMLAAR